MLQKRRISSAMDAVANAVKREAEFIIIFLIYETSSRDSPKHVPLLWSSNLAPRTLGSPKIYRITEAFSFTSQSSLPFIERPRPTTE